ncbi:MAG: helix-turn-helix domain-containing protein, partial [Candidatus Doudnabacteria bacterium]
MRCYAQLTQEERYQIYGHLKAGYNISEIAEEMGRHRSTISREIRRNKGKKRHLRDERHLRDVVLLVKPGGLVRIRVTSYTSKTTSPKSFKSTK